MNTSNQHNEFKDVIALLETADDLGEGGQQREVLAKAIKELAAHIFRLNEAAGN